MKNNKWLTHGLLLGFVFFIAIYLMKPIGVSTQFSVTSGMVHNAVSDVIVENGERKSGYESSNAYYDKSEGKMAATIVNPITYDYVFVLAIPLGGYIAYRLMNKGKKKKPAAVVKQPWKAYVPTFVGAFFLLFGARLADGCTSGHMMSGIMQGALSGYVFAIVVFAVAIPVAMFTYKRGQ